jgi:branched-chain amino acid transport system ATP-binding protein
MEVISGLKKRGLSILMVEQNVDVSLDIADRAYILRTGRIVIEGTAQELKANEDIKRSYLGV